MVKHYFGSVCEVSLENVNIWRCPLINVGINMWALIKSVEIEQKNGGKATSFSLSLNWIIHLLLPMKSELPVLGPLNSVSYISTPHPHSQEFDPGLGLKSASLVLRSLDSEEITPQDLLALQLSHDCVYWKTPTNWDFHTPQCNL